MGLVNKMRAGLEHSRVDILGRECLCKLVWRHLHFDAVAVRGCEFVAEHSPGGLRVAHLMRTSVWAVGCEYACIIEGTSAGLCVASGLVRGWVG
jgi:hypothetical protein